MVRQGNVTRRSFLKRTTGVALGAVGVPYLVRSTALGGSGLSRRASGSRSGAWAPAPGDLCDAELPRTKGLPGRRDLRPQGPGPRGHQEAGGRALQEQRLRHLYGFPRADRPQGHRRGPGRDVRPLARVGCVGGGAGGQRPLCREADGPEPGGGSGVAAGVSSIRHPIPVWNTAAVQPGLSVRLRAGAKQAHRELKTINVWSPGSTGGGPRNVVQPPDWIDYNMWLGPAPYHPYTPGRESNSYWWFISDYALGFIAGWGVHPLDIALWGLGDKVPSMEIEGKGSGPTRTASPIRPSTGTLSAGSTTASR